MNIYHPKADAIAKDYIGTGKPLKELGWGIDGVVYAWPEKSTAVKIHSKSERELSEGTCRIQAAWRARR